MGRGIRLDAALDLLEALPSREVAPRPQLISPDQMHVGVDEPGQDEPAARIEDLSHGAREAIDRALLPHRQDPLAVAREALGPGLGRIARVDACVPHDEARVSDAGPPSGTARFPQYGCGSRPAVTKNYFSPPFIGRAR